MEPSWLRTEPVLDNRPSETFGKGSQALVYVLLMTVGLILIVLGGHERYSHNESWLPEISIAFGVAISTPGILLSLTLIHLVIPGVFHLVW